ncbi:GTP cyclohydrolase I FolE [Ornithinimicrobium humiphilum]|uniref:GTP cyclohydrolase 1 n=1 Tax=Ornithinimicrobium humiphilum TaxID=125288 RepID=A0A543KJM6_9MICO|nr:GTP cyclohydrolase I FolE [Ornithinimicrobium humiphilum]TQM95264.1 GTP cyclohydrolase I [Ornithinimicrobium humiphilum]
MNAVAAVEQATPLRPRIVAERPVVDLEAAEAAAADLLAALGLDLTQESLVDTPRRMARALHELMAPEGFELTSFANEEGYDELVLVRDIPVRSLCEHHMLPLVGVAHVGYLPDRRILGLSKLARMVDLHSRRPQTQERLTTAVADHLRRELAPAGVGVVVEAEHTCMTLRGARAPGARTLTSAVLGRLRDDPSSRAEFLSLARRLP